MLYNIYCRNPIHLWSVRHNVSEPACAFLSTGTKRGERLWAFLLLVLVVLVEFLRVRCNMGGLGRYYGLY